MQIFCESTEKVLSQIHICSAFSSFTRDTSAGQFGLTYQRLSHLLDTMTVHINIPCKYPCIYIYIYVYVYVCVCLSVSVSVSASVSVCVCVCLCMYVHMCVHVYVHSGMQVCTYMHVCVCIYIYIYVCVCIYTYMNITCMHVSTYMYIYTHFTRFCFVLLFCILSSHCQKPFLSSSNSPQRRASYLVIRW